MPVLPLIPLPLPNQPPPGFLPEERSISDNESSGTSTAAFHRGLNLRDQKRCLVCGYRTVKHCHIIPKSEYTMWEDLRRRNYISATAKPVEHEPRNGLSLCPNHHGLFDAHRFFIRYVPEQRKFVFVNYSQGEDDAIFHGKAIKLDVDHRYSPFPSILLIHEWRVRGFYPFATDPLNISSMIEDQDWMKEKISDIEHDPTMNPDDPFTRTTDNGTGNSSGEPPAGMRSVALNDDVIEKILSATRESASWKACEQEGRINRDGTAL
ncbi:hypothetical protein F5887DRAFT_123490 [Amanita rubescens]|nr:hypothetical protein F5887DRAFT_123490 [Amanita rubescens]